MLPRRNSTRLNVEVLEGRTVPAGNVSATLVGSTLRLIGDSLSNGIFVYLQGGNVVVAGDPTTTVNSAGSVSFPAASVAGLDIRMDDKDDTVTLGKTPTNVVTGLTLTRLLQYNGGNGNDTLEIAGVSVSRTATIRGGDGDDSVTINNGTHFSSPVSISLDTGSVSESVSIDNAIFDKPTVIRGSDVNSTINITAATGPTTFNASLSILTRNGDDAITLDGANVSSGPLTITTGDGDDTVALDNGTYKILSLNTGLGDDTVNIGTTTAVDVTLGAAITLGDGANALNIGNGTTTTQFGLLSIRGGSGVDNILLDNISVSLGATTIRTLDGNDSLTILNSSFSPNKVTVEMGNGDDTVTLNSNSFQVGPPHQDLFDGGSGSDTLNGSTANTGLSIPPEVVNFETINP
ncbi:hypothetical protein HRbin36_00704 [bacterium HR36]|nr:hypothetical protein HRbin36_00704 [bacterium HR36]